MSIYNRISAIQMRMQEIQSKFSSNPMTFTSANGINPQGTQVPGISAESGLSFDKLLASKINGPDSLSGAENVKNMSLSADASAYDGIVSEASRTYGVDEKFIKAIIHQESGFNPNATSWCGAMGMMQLMPETAKGLGVKNAYDPRENIMGGVKYIKQQLDSFGGDKEKALAAYNAGPGAVSKYDGVPPYSETQNYVKNIMASYRSMGGA